MNGGVTARIGYRYQDWCSLYFFLDHYVERNADLNFLICENEKLDFEIWLQPRFEAYQAKTTSKISAKELNEIFKYYIGRITTAPDIAKEKGLILLCAQEMEGSLAYLFMELSGKRRQVTSYTRQTQTYIDTALKEIDPGQLQISWRFLTQNDAEQKALGIAHQILEKMYEDKGFPAGLIKSFIDRFRGEIDRLSAQVNIGERKFTREDLDNLIKKILDIDVGYQQRRTPAQKAITTKTHLSESEKLQIAKPIKVAPELKKPTFLSDSQ